MDLSPNIPNKTLEIYVRPNTSIDTPTETPKPDDSNHPPSDETIPDDEVETVPIDPPICESDINTIVWQEQTNTLFQILTDKGRLAITHTHIKQN